MTTSISQEAQLPFSHTVSGVKFVKSGRGRAEPGEEDPGRFMSLHLVTVTLFWRDFSPEKEKKIQVPKMAYDSVSALHTVNGMNSTHLMGFLKSMAPETHAEVKAWAEKMSQNTK